MKTLKEILEKHDVYINTEGNEGKKANLEKANLFEADLFWILS